MIPIIMISTYVGSRTVCNNGAVRLVRDRFDIISGHVEVCHVNDWAPVCESWDIEEVQVACRQLGFSSIGDSLCMCNN